MDRTRRIVLAASAALLPTSLLITASPLSWAIVIFSAMMFGHQCFASIVQTLPADLFPSRYVGSVGGLLGSNPQMFTFANVNEGLGQIREVQTTGVVA